jgi:hypothetical protein
LFFSIPNRSCTSHLRATSSPDGIVCHRLLHVGLDGRACSVRRRTSPFFSSLDFRSCRRRVTSAPRGSCSDHCRGGSRCLDRIGRRAVAVAILCETHRHRHRRCRVRSDRETRRRRRRRCRDRFDPNFGLDLDLFLGSGSGDRLQLGSGDRLQLGLFD